ncbi:hypothetical protein LSM04_009123 [Trypanosoma melophagium]|uniref:uncharacterized protein n=1 Tax=Trypanosoma melophagium TaxID=715481 RepID=UPI00351A881F|nr:hypothetical protein LSM04_009123 [Trypanosoma melophagium]
MVSGVGASRLAIRQLLLREQNEKEKFAISVDNHNNENDILLEGMVDLNVEEEKKDIYEESTLTTRSRKALLSLSRSSLLSVTTTAADREDFQESKMNDDKSILSSQSHAITLSKVECKGKESEDATQLLSSTSKLSSSVTDITSHSVVPNTELLGVQGSSINNSNTNVTINPPFHSSNLSSTSMDQIIQLNVQRKKSLTSHQNPSHSNKWQQKSVFFFQFSFSMEMEHHPPQRLYWGREKLMRRKYYLIVKRITHSL